MPISAHFYAAFAYAEIGIANARSTQDAFSCRAYTAATISLYRPRSGEKK
jgi:hypothetical protein